MQSSCKFSSLSFVFVLALTPIYSHLKFLYGQLIHHISALQHELLIRIIHVLKVLLIYLLFRKGAHTGILQCCKVFPLLLTLLVSKVISIFYKLFCYVKYNECKALFICSTSLVVIYVYISVVHCFHQQIRF